MSHRDTFTPVEAEQIRRLLGKMSTIGTGQQRTIRRKLRELGFYITDYEDAHRGFSVVDFDRLVSSGRISIAA